MAPRRKRKKNIPTEKGKKKLKDSSSCLSNLNNDVLLEIFVKLPIKSLCRFKCVSKPWNALIQNTTLSDSRRRASKPFLLDLYEGGVGIHLCSIDHTSGLSTIVHTHKLRGNYALSYSNGLACIFKEASLKSKVLNLTTGESIDLPDVDYIGEEDFDEEEERTSSIQPHVDFGFDPSTNRYTLLFTDYIYCPWNIGVFTLKPNSCWKTISDTKSIRNMEDCVSANGKLFWLNDDNRIVYLNLSNKEFGEVDLSRMCNEVLNSYSLMEYEGYICLVETPRLNLQKSHFEISHMWMLKDAENQVWVLMMKDAILPFKGTQLSSSKWIQYKPSFLALNEEILMIVSDKNKTYMFISNLLNKEFKRIKLRGLPKGKLAWSNHVENYCSLEDFV